MDHHSGWGIDKSGDGYIHLQTGDDGLKLMKEKRGKHVGTTDYKWELE